MNNWQANNLSQLLGIQHPIILAPMFLISDVNMTLAALEAGITAAIPALNYRTIEELRDAIQSIKQKSSNPFGINLIANASNLYLEKQLEVCCQEKVAFIITSLGNPKEIITQAKKNNILVFCDVVDIKYAKKVEELGADAVIAVSREAGGHAGAIPFDELLKDLQNNIQLPIISAGGVGDYLSFSKRMELGAFGVSVGTVFIASKESPVSKEYKQACIDYDKEDIVLTTKLSGTPCTVINTPYVKQVGTKQNFFERILNKNKRLKKFFKMLTFLKGMKKLKKAAFSQTYQSVWCAGPSITFVKEILPISAIVKKITSES